MVDDTTKSLGGKKLNRSDRLLEDALPPKGRIREAYSSFKIAKDYYDKTPQAVVKVTSYLSGKSDINDHHDYISRNGDIELETESGEILNNVDDIKDLLDEWSVDFKGKKTDILTSYKISISNSDPKKVKDIYSLAKKYSKEYFSNYEFRVDKGSYKGNINNVYISIKQRDIKDDLPDLNDINDRFNLLFKDYDISVNHKEKQQARDVVNIMMSAPNGNDSKAVKRAVRNTAQTYFGDKGYRYVFALHDPDTDKDSKNPHVHISVKMFNEITGKRLRLNPKDLIEIRELFASKSREQGINMTASLRYQRGLLKDRKSIKEIKLTEKEKIKGNNIKKNKALKASIMQVSEQRNNPVFRELQHYRKTLKTHQDFVDTAKKIKDQSFGETNKKKKYYLIQLYKTLQLEADKLSKSKVHQLNEDVRNNYKSDAQVLKEYSETQQDAETKQAIQTMAATLEKFSNEVPRAITPRDRLHMVVAEMSEKQPQKSINSRDRKEKDGGLER